MVLTIADNTPGSSIAYVSTGHRTASASTLAYASAVHRIAYSQADSSRRCVSAGHCIAST
eukprot:951406-Rhodomonas_salina.4